MKKPSKDGTLQGVFYRNTNANINSRFPKSYKKRHTSRNLLGLQMIGAIIGDIVGSVYEFQSHKPSYDFKLFTPESFFTDDTVLTVALADSILCNVSYLSMLEKYFNKYPDADYGGGFLKWAHSGFGDPYNSFGNGSAMRVSPVGWAFNSIDDVLFHAKESASFTHNHPEGIKGAQAAAVSIFMARTGASKKDIKEYVEKIFAYELGFDFDDLVTHYSFNETCQNTVPQAIYTFLISDSFEDSIRKAVMIGGDSDTLPCINGGIAEAFYGVSNELKHAAFEKLDPVLLSVTKSFINKYVNLRL